MGFRRGGAQGWGWESEVENQDKGFLSLSGVEAAHLHMAVSPPRCTPVIRGLGLWGLVSSKHLQALWGMSCE